MLHTKFHENRPAGSGEEDFCTVFTIYGRGSPAVSEKNTFEKCVWTTDWPRSRDDLDLH